MDIPLYTCLISLKKMQERFKLVDVVIVLPFLCACSRGLKLVDMVLVFALLREDLPAEVLVKPAGAGRKTTGGYFQLF